LKHFNIIIRTATNFFDNYSVGQINHFFVSLKRDSTFSKRFFRAHDSKHEAVDRICIVHQDFECWNERCKK